MGDTLKENKVSWPPHASRSSEPFGNRFLKSLELYLAEKQHSFKTFSVIFCFGDDVRLMSNTIASKCLKML